MMSRTAASRGRASVSASTGEGSCECERCVTPESHGGGHGELTIQKAIDDVVKAGGGRVCLAPGDYGLDATLKISGARSLTLVGAGSVTRLISPNDVGILVQDSVEVSLERFALLAGAAAGLAAKPPQFVGADGKEIAVALINTLDCRVQRCFVVAGVDPVDGPDGQPVQASVGIGLSGWALRPRLLDNVVLASIAVGDITPGRTAVPPPPPPLPAPGFTAPFVPGPVGGSGAGAINAAVGTIAPYLATADLAIEDNLLLGIRFGIDIGASALGPSGVETAPRILAAATRIERNLVLGGGEAGMSLLGMGPSGPGSITIGLGGLPKVDELGPLLKRAAVVVVADNVLSVTGHGIRARVDELRIDGNTIRGSGTGDQSPSTAGIDVQLFAEPQRSTVRIRENAITDFGGVGIVLLCGGAGVEIADNRLSQLGKQGIWAGGVPSLADLRIVDNVLAEVGLRRAPAPTAITAFRAERAMVCRNVVRAFAPQPLDVAELRAISVTGCGRARIEGNQLSELGPGQDDGARVIGIFAGDFQTLDVDGNTVHLDRGERRLAVALAIGDAATFKDAQGFDPRKEGLMAGLPEAIVRGNVLHATGRDEPVVLVSGKLGLTFSDNRCRWLAPARAAPIVFASVLGASIVASNRAEGPKVTPSGPGAVAIDVPVPVVEEKDPCTMLGNIANGRIEINHSLKPAWVPLNIMITT